jgi:PPOX class probable F420-dependent enzyme
MPGYGLTGPDSGTGLLPWSWAQQRLSVSESYWLATLHPDGRPHVMPVWGVWHGDACWFSCGPQSRKARNLDRDPRATVTTDDPHQPLVVEAVATRVADPAALVEFTELVNAKYGTSYPVSFFGANATYRLRPVRAFGLLHEDFTGSPTRWDFEPVR